MPHILVVEDDLALQKMAVQALKAEGYSVQGAKDGIAALAAHRDARADLIVLDLMLPVMDGFQVLRNLRERKDNVPVLMLTARGAEVDRVQGLNLGADDYLVKPYSVPELQARVKAILRRYQSGPKGSRILLSGPFLLDLVSFTLHRNDILLDLTPRELKILSVLMTDPSRIHSRTSLLHQAWEVDAQPSPRTVDVHIANLRKKLGDETGKQWITTVGGEGYRWTAPVQEGA